MSVKFYWSNMENIKRWCEWNITFSFCVCRSDSVIFQGCVSGVSPLLLSNIQSLISELNSFWLQRHQHQKRFILICHFFVHNNVHLPLFSQKADQHKIFCFTFLMKVSCQYRAVQSLLSSRCGIYSTMSPYCKKKCVQNQCSFNWNFKSLFTSSDSDASAMLLQMGCKAISKWQINLTLALMLMLGVTVQDRIHTVYLGAISQWPRKRWM